MSSLTDAPERVMEQVVGAKHTSRGTRSASVLTVVGATN